MEHRLIVFLSLAAPALVAAAPARDEGQAVDRMVELNERALSDWEGGDLAAAKQKLNQAASIGARAGLGLHKMMARTYLHLGALNLAGLKDRATGERYLRRALEIRGDIQATGIAGSAEVVAVLESLRKPQGATATTPPPAAAAPAEPKPEAPKPPASDPPSPAKKDLVSDLLAAPAAMTCAGPEEATAGKNAPITCEAPGDSRVARVMLLYRAPGDVGFVTVPMTRASATTFNGAIPTRTAAGRSLQYYAEARDAGGAIVATAGSPQSPSVLLIGGKAAEDPGETSSPAPARWRRDDDPLVALARERERAAATAGRHRRGPGSVLVGLGLGSGYGWHPRSRLELRRDLQVDPGLGAGGDFQALPEVAYQWDESWVFAVQMRIQLIQGRGSEDPAGGRPARGAVAVLARVQRLFGEGNTQLAVSGTVGAGDGFRLVVPPNGDALPRHDTVRGGPLLLGPGVGLLHHLSRTVALAIDTRLLVGAPDLAAVADLGVGVQIAF